MRRHIHFQVREPQVGSGLSSSAAQTRPHTGQKLREGKWLHKIVICPAVQSFHPIFNCVSSREDQNRGLQPAFSQCCQHLESVPTWEHQVQDDQVKFLGIHKKEPFFTGWCNNDFILLALQSLTKGSCHFRFVFDDEDSQLWSDLLHHDEASVLRCHGISHCEIVRNPFPGFTRLSLSRTESVWTTSEWR